MSLVFGAQKNWKKGRSLDKGSNRDEACLLSSSCRTGKLQEQNDMLSSCYKMTQMISLGRAYTWPWTLTCRQRFLTAMFILLWLMHTPRVRGAVNELCENRAQIKLQFIWFITTNCLIQLFFCLPLIHHGKYRSTYCKMWNTMPTM